LQSITKFNKKNTKHYKKNTKIFAKYGKVLQTITDYYKVLQSIIQSIIQNITEYYKDRLCNTLYALCNTLQYIEA